MKLVVEQIYKVSFETKTGMKSSFIGEYCGIETNPHVTETTECGICWKEGHAKLHQFNIPYAQDTKENMLQDLKDLKYETIYFGTACIKKVNIEVFN